MRISHHSFFAGTTKFLLLSFAALFVASSLIGRYASAAEDPSIPEDSIRIRIVAHSDKKADQSVKNKVRAAVAAYIESWGPMPSSHDEAYELIESRLPRVQKLVDDKLEELGAPYGGAAELREVPFPEKTFKGETYASGDYEALRITLGDGEGANWWCVLFPPLCLTAATAKEEPASATKPASAGGASGAAAAGPSDDEPKAKFFLVVLFEKLFAFIGSLFG